MKEKSKVGKQAEGSKRREEFFKVIKWSLTGIGSSVAELAVFALLLEFAFTSIREKPINNVLLNFIGIKYAGYLISYFISACVGYGLAFIINRKYTFKADSNLAVSATINILFTLFNILVVTWIGTALSNLSVTYEWGTIGDVIIKALVMLVPSIWTYPMNRFVIHRQKKKQ